MIGRKCKIWGGSEKQSALKLMWRQAADCSRGGFHSSHRKRTIADGGQPCTSDHKLRRWWRPKTAAVGIGDALDVVWRIPRRQTSFSPRRRSVDATLSYLHEYPSKIFISFTLLHNQKRTYLKHQHRNHNNTVTLFSRWYQQGYTTGNASLCDTVKVCWWWCVSVYSLVSHSASWCCWPSFFVFDGNTKFARRNPLKCSGNYSYVCSLSLSALCPVIHSNDTLSLFHRQIVVSWPRTFVLDYITDHMKLVLGLVDCYSSYSGKGRV